MKNFRNIQVDESNILTWQGLIVPVSGFLFHIIVNSWNHNSPVKAKVHRSPVVVTDLLHVWNVITQLYRLLLGYGHCHTN